jgi:flagellar motor protein MotB
MRSWTIVSLFAFLAFVSIGCQDKVHDENISLHRQNRELQAKNTQLEEDLSKRPDASQIQTYQNEIASRDAKIAELQSQLRQPPPGQPQENAWQGIEVTRDRAGTVTVNLPGDVLFDSGKADLKSSAKTTLSKVVAAIKKEYPGKRVFVNGYTDTDPISRTKDKWEDNLDLSAARARSVSQYLVEQGLDRRLVGPRAFGDTQPRGSKSASRRVEVVVSAQ